MTDSSQQPVIVKEAKGVIRLEVQLLNLDTLSLLQQTALHVAIDTWGPEQSFISPPYDPLFDYPTPLLATFEITGELLKARFRFVPSRTAHYYLWLRENIVEIRPNRYEPGLWIHVKGQVMETFLSELPPDAIEQLAAALNAALGRKTPNG